MGSAFLPTRQLSRRVDRLPVGENVRPVGAFEIVGERNALDPVAAVAVG